MQMVRITVQRLLFQVDIPCIGLLLHLLQLLRQVLIRQLILLIWLWVEVVEVVVVIVVVAVGEAVVQEVFSPEF